MKWFKVWKDKEIVYKTTSLALARDYRDKNGGVIKNKRWIVE
jgi:hypothetical protein